MMIRMKYICLLVVFVLDAACGGAPAPKPKLAPKPPPELPFGDIPMGFEPFDLETAEQLVEMREAGWPPPADDPLREPSSLADVERILKLDQVNLFRVAVAFAAKDDSVRAKALQAQIELAWGESYTVLMEACLQLGRQVDRITLSMQQAQRLSSAEEAYLERLQTLSDRIGRVVELFQVISLSHVAQGAKLAARLIEMFPDNYLGYRVAADHKRLIRDWHGFEQMVEKVESVNPNSNGLSFLHGAAALQRDDDRATAIEYYRQALARDPAFVRAQSHLVMAQTDLDGLVDEYEKLKTMNPAHQMVQWMDAAIELTKRRAR